MRICILTSLLALSAAPGWGDGPDLELQRSLTGSDCWPWQRIECWANLDSHFRQETFLPQTSHLPASIFGVGIPEAFGGTTQPHSRNFLLHFAEGWEEARRPVPVLLVHGCQSDATRSFASVWFDGRPGLMQFLSEQGFAVFAVTMPAGQGDLYFQAEHIAAAIQLIKERTGAPEVDVLAHSAGGISARMYLTGVRKKWGTRYQKDIRRMLFVATPHQGMDFLFRHPIAFVRFAAYGMPAPWEWYAPMGDIEAQSIYSDAYRMQQMLLADLSSVHPLNETEVDWHSTWHGGAGYVSRSRGLAAAIALGDDHIATVRKARFPRKTEVYVLAGDFNELEYFQLGTKNLLVEPGEYDGPSDGICFLASATDPQGFKDARADLRETRILHLNHVALLFDRDAQTFIAETFAGGPLDDQRRIPSDSSRPVTSDHDPRAVDADATVVGPRD